MEVEDVTSGCVGKNETVGSHKELTLEAVMEEITCLKLLVTKMMKKQDSLQEGFTNEVHLLRRSFASVQTSLEVLEIMVVSKDNDSPKSFKKEAYKDPHVLAEQERFAKELAEIGVSSKSGNVDESFGTYIHQGFVRSGFGEGTYTHQDFDGGSSSVFGGMETVDDHTVDVNVTKRKVSTSVGKAFVPDHWLEEDTPLKGRTSSKQTLLITRSDYKRHSHFSQTAPSMVPDSGVNKKLKFHTPSPNGTQSRSSKSSSKVYQSGKKVNVKLEGGASKRYRKTGGVTPKAKETHLGEGTKSVARGAEMSFNLRNARVCSYLFQQSADANLRNETLVLSMGLTATWAELQCLIPLAPITEVVIALVAARITTIHTDRKSVWVLPPSFALDMDDGLSLAEIRAKYCQDWMPPYPNLKFIYIPLREKGHWYLMLVHVESGITYHLDTNCPDGCAVPRAFKMKTMGLLLYHLVDDAKYLIVFPNKQIEFHKYQIVRVSGIPNLDSSDNSGVWLLHWLSMEHYFNPYAFYNTMNEKEVRLKNAADLLIGDQNVLRFEVLRNTDEYFKTIEKKRVVNKPIDLDTD